MNSNSSFSDEDMVRLYRNFGYLVEEFVLNGLNSTRAVLSMDTGDRVELTVQYKNLEEDSEE